jgi:8-oxo-dGTP pyrophosphatase MutT (NUDIX family)
MATLTIGNRETRRGAVIEQSGVIPYRIRRGRVEIALVTASSGPHWTIPKGHVEPELTPEESAAKEAFEESGLIGRVSSRAVGSYTYEKRGVMRQVVLFPLAVDKELKRWPEMNERTRRWMSADQAASLVRSAELGCCIQRFERSIRRRSEHALAA